MLREINVEGSSEHQTCSFNETLMNAVLNYADYHELKDAIKFGHP
jgi:hypothetical protein